MTLPTLSLSVLCPEMNSVFYTWSDHWDCSPFFTTSQRSFNQRYKLVVYIRGFIFAIVEGCKKRGMLETSFEQL